MSQVYIGTDPEVFLTLGGRPITAAGILPGTKAEPFAVECGAIQVDGNAAEFNIDAALTEDAFNKNIETVLVQLNEMVHLVDKDIQLNFQPYMEFDFDYWKANVPDEAKILGCDPDYSVNGFGMDVNPDPSLVLDKLEQQGKAVRTAAGHIHIGWTKERDVRNDDGHFGDCKMIAKNFHTRGVYKPVSAAEKSRLQYYGANGAFRPKKYGVELREPSNIWVGTEAGRRNTFATTRKVFQEITGL